MARTILITGGSGGIGAAMTEAFVRDGWQVFCQYHTGEAAAAGLARQGAGGAGGCVPLYADLSKEADCAALVEKVLTAAGGLDALVNNAGIAQQKLIQDVTERDWQQMLDIHLTAAYRLIRGFAPAMIRQQTGCILNISSVWGRHGGAMEAHYSAAKAGLEGLTLALAKELGPSGIRVNAIAPGVIRTAMTEGFSDETLAALVEATPLGRIGLPADIAELALFLASEKASFITGQIIGVDGGFPR